MLVRWFIVMGVVGSILLVKRLRRFILTSEEMSFDDYKRSLYDLYDDYRSFCVQVCLRPMVFSDWLVVHYHEEINKENKGGGE